MSIHKTNTSELIKSFSDEYESEDAIRKYSTETAGHGIGYLLEHEYAKVYLEAIRRHLKTSPRRPLRVLEFGCGAGMNLIRLAAQLENQNIPLESAYGTDFSTTLITRAKQEAREYLSEKQRSKVTFHVASNERLVADLTAACGAGTSLAGSFDLIIGVNTFRYCHRLNAEDDCALDIKRLLRPGGVSVVIDMNDRFPLFRSRLKAGPDDPNEAYLPSLDEYASPFDKAGFEILTKSNFCWIPHSAGAAMTVIGRALTPVLNTVARRYAMRSLVVARKPV
jgi:SAM-dependent methyltransferase